MLSLYILFMTGIHSTTTRTPCPAICQHNSLHIRIILVLPTLPPTRSADLAHLIRLRYTDHHHTSHAARICFLLACADLAAPSTPCLAGLGSCHDTPRHIGTHRRSLPRVNWFLDEETGFGKPVQDAAFGLNIEQAGTSLRDGLALGREAREGAGHAAQSIHPGWQSCVGRSGAGSRIRR
ncbi:hypothetical protein BDV93DRAFT_38406 [Ceratobasidium sp. AG-I]|nr:hypothetical protein BDV93DRAFT_38406 [Ceratobasidium sp. AG-I]